MLLQTSQEEGTIMCPFYQGDDWVRERSPWLRDTRRLNSVWKPGSLSTMPYFSNTWLTRRTRRNWRPYEQAVPFWCVHSSTYYTVITTHELPDTCMLGKKHCWAAQICYDLHPYSICIIWTSSTTPVTKCVNRTCTRSQGQGATELEEIKNQTQRQCLFCTELEFSCGNACICWFKKLHLKIFKIYYCLHICAKICVPLCTCGCQKTTWLFPEIKFKPSCLGNKSWAESSYLS